MKVFTIKITEEDYRYLQDVAKIAYNKDKHRANYGVGAFLKESALNRAKRILKRKQ